MMEYWAHEASYIRPEHFPDLLLWQKRTWVGAAAHGSGAARLQWPGRSWTTLPRGRPMTAAELTAQDRATSRTAGTDNWGWNWNAVKRVLEHLFEEGLVSAASRTEQFERRYTLTARVLPDFGWTAAGRSADPAEAMHRLIDAAAQAHGIGTVRCFADYFRTPVKAAAAAVEHLVATGRLEPVTVAGWDRMVFRHVEARLPRRADGAGPAESLRLAGLRAAPA